MSLERSDMRNGSDPLAQIERAFIEEFLRARGYSLAALHDLPAEQAKRLLTEASVYASGRLTEVESRAHFVRDIHDGHQPAPGQGRARRS